MWQQNAHVPILKSINKGVATGATIVSDGKYGTFKYQNLKF